MSDVRARILTAAEARIRCGGYNGFSFRDIARDTGLTNAGVHHHFPTKADLVRQVAGAYTDRFLEQIDAAPPPERLSVICALFARSAARDGRMCLCGLLAAEGAGLPAEITHETRRFFEALLSRLTEVFSAGPAPEARAFECLALLEGGVLLSRTLGGSGAIGDAETLFARVTRGMAA